MKLLVLCLFAVCCCSLVSATATEQRRRLGEIRVNLKTVRDKLCGLSLRCFRLNLRSINEKFADKLISGLQKNATVSKSVRAPCQECFSHPKENAAVFFSRLESLIQQVRVFVFHKDFTSNS
uniref:Interleukin 21 n=1 Tax=Sphaeramia orbicularis TaxID=375764 RepID=A0A673A769_9TELE